MTSPQLELIHAYVGPSMPFGSFPDFVKIHPPAKHGDLNEHNISPNVVTVFIDGLFFHSPAVSHFDLLSLLAAGRKVLGAGSMGALRAVDLRRQGMVGIGSVYHYYLRGHITDDSELAEAVCPYTFQPLTFPLVRVRRAFALALADNIGADLLDAAFASAAKIHFMERRLSKVRHLWSCILPSTTLKLLLDILQSPESDIKAYDAWVALQAATEFLSTGQLAGLYRKPQEIYVRE